MKTKMITGLFAVLIASGLGRRARYLPLIR